MCGHKWRIFVCDYLGTVVCDLVCVVRVLCGEVRCGSKCCGVGLPVDCGKRVGVSGVCTLF